MVRFKWFLGIAVMVALLIGSSAPFLVNITPVATASTENVTANDNEESEPSEGPRNPNPGSSGGTHRLSPNGKAGHPSYQLPKRILFLHDGSSDIGSISNTEWDGLSDMATMLRGTGFTLTERNLDPINLEDVQSFDVVVFSAYWESRKLEDSEAQVLVDFVENGGGLLLLGEYGIASWSDKWNGSVNKVGEHFGVTFNFDMICDPTDHYYHWDDPDTGVDQPFITDIISHEVTAGISKFVVGWGCSLQVSNPSKAIAYTDDDAWLDINSVWNSDLGHWECYKDSFEAIGKFPVLAVCEYGLGKVVALNDSSLFVNDWLDECDAYDLAQNIFDWLYVEKEPVDLNPHFVADKTEVEVGETVTFYNLTTYGMHPYFRAEWDFDCDGIADTVIEGTEAQVMADVTWAYDTPGIYSVGLTMTDSTPTTRWDIKFDYITVTGETPAWRRDIKTGDILLHRKDRGLACLGFEYTHSGIYIGDGLVAEALPEGIKQYPITKWDFSKDTWVALLRVTGATNTQREQAANWAKEQTEREPKPPSFRIWVTKSSDPNSETWYCAELVWAAYYNQDKINLDPDGRWTTITPDELYETSLTEPVGPTGGHHEEYPEFDCPIMFTILAKSPVDLVVTDPDGLTVSNEYNYIAECWYIESDFNGDGLAEDAIIVPQLKDGDYLIAVIPEPNASPTDTYGLEVMVNNQTIVLAEDVPISDIPSEPYVFESDVILPGDANGDGVVNNLDITKVERIIVGLDTETPGADANQDGVVNNLDITKVERIIVGLD